MKAQDFFVLKLVLLWYFVSKFQNGYYEPKCAVTPSIGEWTKTGTDIFVNFTADQEENVTFEIIGHAPTQMSTVIFNQRKKQLFLL